MRSARIWCLYVIGIHNLALIRVMGKGYGGIGAAGGLESHIVTLESMDIPIFFCTLIILHPITGMMRSSHSSYINYVLHFIDPYRRGVIHLQYTSMKSLHITTPRLQIFGYLPFLYLPIPATPQRPFVQHDPFIQDHFKPLFSFSSPIGSAFVHAWGSRISRRGHYDSSRPAVCLVGLSCACL